MRGLFKAAMAFGLLALLAGPAMAQGRGGRGGQGGPGGFGGGGPINLLGNPSVQKELNLDDAQKEKVTALVTQTREKMTSVRDQLQGLQASERMTRQQELARPINESALQTAATFLKPEQLKRLHEIELQQRGPAQALADPAIAKKLNISPEQATKIKALMTEMQSQASEIRTAAGTDRQAAMQKAQALRRETNTKVAALLTDEQKATWKELTGAPFEIVQQPRRQP
jgi:hypothetical protein